MHMTSALQYPPLRYLQLASSKVRLFGPFLIPQNIMFACNTVRLKVEAQGAEGAAGAEAERARKLELLRAKLKEKQRY